MRSAVAVHREALRRLLTLGLVALAAGLATRVPVAAQDAAAMLRDLVTRVGVSNDYKPLRVLAGADDGTCAQLAALLADSKLSPRSRFVAAIALSYVRTPAARAALLKTAADPDGYVRRGIALSLRYFSDDSGQVRQVLSGLAANDPYTITDAAGRTHFGVRETAQASLDGQSKAPLAAPSPTPIQLPAVPTPATGQPAAVGAVAQAPAGATATAAPPPARAAVPTPAAAAIWETFASPLPGLPECLSRLQVPGTWERLPESSGTLQTGPQGQMLVTLGEGQSALLRRAEPFPTGPWTLDLWHSCSTVPAADQLTLTVGTPPQALVIDLKVGDSATTVEVRAPGTAGQRSRGYSVYHARGPVQWLQVSHSPARTIEVRLNGVAMPEWQEALDPPTAPVTLAVGARKAAVARVASLTVGPYAPLAPPEEGLLCGGWSTPPRPLSVADPAALAALLRRYASAAEGPAPSRAYAQVALALVGRAQAGQVPDDSWQLLERPWLVQVLPLLLACMSEPQRQAAAPLIAQARSDLRGLLNGPNLNRGAFSARTALFAPRAVAELMKREYHVMDHFRLSAWLEALLPTDPCTGFSLCNGLPTNYHDPRYQAWLAVLMRRAVPNYSRLLLENCLSGPYADDCCLRAAVAIAPGDREAALALYARLRPPWYREWAEAALGLQSPPVLPAADAAVLERALRNAVSSWKPSRSEKTPAKPMLKVVEFLDRQGRAAEAQAVAREMASRVEALPQPGYSELAPVMRAFCRLHLPGAEAWTERATAAARAADAEAEEPDPGSDEVYAAPTYSLARFLCEQRRFEEATALALTLSPDRLPMNYNNCLVHIASECAPTQPERVQDLLGRLVDEEHEERTDRQLREIGRLLALPGLADGGWPERWATVLPPERRAAVEVRRQIALGHALTGELREYFGRMCNEELKHTRSTRGEGYSHRGWALRQVDRLPLGELLQYEPFLAEDPDFYCYQLLSTLIGEAGLAEDPLWRVWRVPADEQGYQLPWEVPVEQLRAPGVPGE